MLIVVLQFQPEAPFQYLIEQLSWHCYQSPFQLGMPGIKCVAFCKQNKSSVTELCFCPYLYWSMGDVPCVLLYLFFKNMHY